jgi:hypothetical protein
MGQKPEEPQKVSINRCLCTILKLQWSKTTKEDLWERARQQLVEQEPRYRRWRWLGHMIRRPRESITRQALSWNPQGKQRKGRPRNTLRCEMESEIKRTRMTQKDLERTAFNRKAWKDVVEGLCLQEAKEECKQLELPF